MAWTTVPDTDIDADSPITVALMTALRDNVSATAAGDSGAPSIQRAAMASDNLPRLVLIGSQSASASAAIDFTSGFDASAYDDYIFIVDELQLATAAADMEMQVSVDAGSSWISQYYIFATRYDVTSYNGIATSGVRNNVTYASQAAFCLTHGAAHPTYIAIVNGTVTLRKASSTVNNGHQATWEMSACSQTNAIAGRHDGAGNAWGASSNDIDGIRFKASSGNLTSGTIYMFGVAK